MRMTPTLTVLKVHAVVRERTRGPKLSVADGLMTLHDYPAQEPLTPAQLS